MESLHSEIPRKKQGALIQKHGGWDTGSKTNRERRRQEEGKTKGGKGWHDLRGSHEKSRSLKTQVRGQLSGKENEGRGGGEIQDTYRIRGSGVGCSLVIGAETPDP